MARVEPTDSSSEQDRPLYDYLYRDTNRIASYAAQLFEGLLTGLQKAESKRKSDERQTAVGIPPAVHTEKGIGDNSRVQTQSFDPHDIVTGDVLSRLLQSGRVSTDVVEAPHGALVLVSGTLVFIDRHISELAIGVYDALLNAGDTAAVPGLEAGSEGAFFLRMVKGFLSSLSFPSAFLLQSEDGVQVAGTLKELGMEEPISTYYFKHGAAGLAGVNLVGIKEVPTPSVTLPDTEMLGAGQQVAQSLSDMIFPSTATRVTPVALFRKL